MAPGIIEAGPASGPEATLEPQTETETAPARSQPDHEEYQYLDLIRDIIDNGEHRPDRTGTGTYSVFAPAQPKYTLSRPAASPTPTHTHDLLLPLFTTKRVFLRAILAELLWFLSADTSAATLAAQDVHIWDGNGSRAFLDSVGLAHREQGDLGPVYGFQWRHFGAAYKDAKTDYAGQGFDQVAEVVRKLKASPFDRRIILSAWNPADLGKMALPPCHMFAQFYVSFPSGRRKDGRAVTGEEKRAADGEGKGGERGVLHAVLYQRSCDMGLGVPFNVASYALLTHMLAHECDLIPGTLTHTMGDAHVYLDHVDALEEQLTREPRDFPTLRITREKGLGIDGWKAEDFVVEGYKPHKAVAMKMSV